MLRHERQLVRRRRRRRRWYTAMTAARVALLFFHTNSQSDKVHTYTQPTLVRFTLLLHFLFSVCLYESLALFSLYVSYEAPTSITEQNKSTSVTCYLIIKRAENLYAFEFGLLPD